VRALLYGLEMKKEKRKNCSMMFISVQKAFTSELCYGNTPLTGEALVDRIKGEVRTRVMSNKKLKNSSGRLSKQWSL
jgi:hypothetical protein